MEIPAQIMAPTTLIWDFPQKAGRLVGNPSILGDQQHMMETKSMICWGTTYDQTGRLLQ